MIDIVALEAELKKRLAHPATPWDRRQNDVWDKATNFIYRTATWDALRDAVRSLKPAGLRNYAINRWFNFWSAVGVETIFTRQSGVTPGPYKHRLIDFSIAGLTFDHKTTVFPAAYFPGSLYAAAYPAHLAAWLYAHQSGEQRHHLGNRLFLVLYNFQGAHWRLRAELGLIRGQVETYVRNFDPARLITLQLTEDHTALTDIIWIPGSPLAEPPEVVSLEDWNSYLARNNLQVVPDSLRFEPDPDHPGRERAAVTVVPSSSPGGPEGQEGAAE